VRRSLGGEIGAHEHEGHAALYRNIKPPQFFRDFGLGGIEELGIKIQFLKKRPHAI